MRVQVKVNSGPHRPLIPYLAPPGPVDWLLSTRGRERDRKSWGLGEGGLPQPLGTPGKEVSLGT